MSSSANPAPPGSVRTRLSYSKKGTYNDYTDGDPEGSIGRIKQRHRKWAKDLKNKAGFLFLLFLKTCLTMLPWLARTLYVGPSDLKFGDLPLPSTPVLRLKVWASISSKTNLLIKQKCDKNFIECHPIMNIWCKHVFFLCGSVTTFGSLKLVCVCVHMHVCMWVCMCVCRCPCVPFLGTVSQELSTVWRQSLSSGLGDCPLG